MLQAIRTGGSSSVFSPVTCRLAEHMLQACQRALSLCGNPAGQPASPWGACAVSTSLQSRDPAAGNQVLMLSLSPGPHVLPDDMPHPCKFEYGKPDTSSQQNHRMQLCAAGCAHALLMSALQKGEDSSLSKLKKQKMRQQVCWRLPACLQMGMASPLYK